jgi:hypothetical protein
MEWGNGGGIEIDRVGRRELGNGVGKGGELR